MAGDPNAFPEQISAGLKPWKPRKLYMDSLRENKAWSLRVDKGEYSSYLGVSYQQFGDRGLRYQRSQGAGGRPSEPGPSYSYYARLDGPQPPPKEESYFDGLDTSLSGMARLAGSEAGSSSFLAPALAAIQTEVENAVRDFRINDLSVCAPALARGLKAARDMIPQVQNSGLTEDIKDHLLFLLKIKADKFQTALNLSLGIYFSAVGIPPNLPEPTGPAAMFARAPLLGVVIPGQAFEVRARLTNRGRLTINPTSFDIQVASGWTAKRISEELKLLGPNATATARYLVTVAENAAGSQPYYHRQSPAENLYTLENPAYLGLPNTPPPVQVGASYSLKGLPVRIEDSVHTREFDPIYGESMRELTVAPAISVNVKPAQGIIPLGQKSRSFDLEVRLLCNAQSETTGQLTLEMPVGWTSRPTSQAFRFTRAGEEGVYTFQLQAGPLESRDYTVEAVARSGGKEYRWGYDIIKHPDLETRDLYHPSKALLRGVDVKVAEHLHVGYVMGVGDEVPEAIRQLGAQVTLLGDNDLACGDLSRFGTIVLGQRAYAVREDLKAYNQRLLEYVKNGGTLVVCNTQEFDPKKYAPYPAELTARAEEVSKEDSPMEILQSADPVFTTPNKITLKDFDGWVEQRGSKFWSQWDKAYTPLLSTHDKNQAPQQGGLLKAQYGTGFYVYGA